MKTKESVVLKWIQANKKNKKEGYFIKRFVKRKVLQ